MKGKDCLHSWMKEQSIPSDAIQGSVLLGQGGTAGVYELTADFALKVWAHNRMKRLGEVDHLTGILAEEGVPVLQYLTHCGDDVVRPRGGRAWAVMPRGEDLQEALEGLGLPEQAQSLQQAEELISRMHAAGIVHLDCKVDNMLVVDGQILIGDPDTIIRIGSVPSIQPAMAFPHPSIAGKKVSKWSGEDVGPELDWHSWDASLKVLGLPFDSGCLSSLILIFNLFVPIPSFIYLSFLL